MDFENWVWAKYWVFALVVKLLAAHCGFLVEIKIPIIPEIQKNKFLDIWKKINYDFCTYNLKSQRKKIENVKIVKKLISVQLLFCIE